MEAKRNLVVDVVVLIVYLVAANPSLTGIALHEWLGLGTFVVFLVHLALHMEWVVETLRGISRPGRRSRIGAIALAALALLAFCVCAVSGLMVSATVLPAMGFVATGYYFWDPLHAASAKILLALLLVHVVVHWRWIVSFLRRARSGDGPSNAIGRGYEDD